MQYIYFILVQDHSIRFGSRPHPSSGVHKTVVTATGTSHMVVQLLHSNVANGQSSRVHKTVVTATGTSHMVV